MIQYLYLGRVGYDMGLRLQAEMAGLVAEGSRRARDSVKCYHDPGAPGPRRTVSFAMNKARQATLNAIFARPTKADIRWSAIESLIRALGGEVMERAGSRVAARLNGVTAVFHRPHPRPETKKGAVEAVRQFLTNAGVKP